MATEGSIVRNDWNGYIIRSYGVFWTEEGFWHYSDITSAQLGFPLLRGFFFPMNLYQHDCYWRTNLPAKPISIHGVDGFSRIGGSEKLFLFNIFQTTQNHSHKEDNFWKMQSLGRVHQRTCIEGFADPGFGHSSTNNTENIVHLRKIRREVARGSPYFLDGPVSKSLLVNTSAGEYLRTQTILVDFEIRYWFDISANITGGDMRLNRELYQNSRVTVFMSK